LQRTKNANGHFVFSKPPSPAEAAAEFLQAVPRLRMSQKCEWHKGQEDVQSVAKSKSQNTLLDLRKACCNCKFKHNN